MGTAGASDIELPVPVALVSTVSSWHYPSFTSEGGFAGLRVWAAEGCGHFAIVTETGRGTSVTNAIRYIAAEIARDYPGRLTLIEHYPPAAGPGGEEHWDHVTVAAGPSWTRLWPASPQHPRYAARRAWVTAHGPVTGIGPVS